MRDRERECVYMYVCVCVCEWVNEDGAFSYF